jgi:sarcosine oxidase delta subunit
MLPEFAYRGGLPAASGLGTWRTPGNKFAMMFLDIFSHGRTGALKSKPASQLLTDQCVVKRLANRNKLSQEFLHRFGPKRFVVATRRSQTERLLTCKPLSAQRVETSSSDLEPLGGRLPVHLATVKQFKDLGYQFRTSPLG